MQRQMQMQDKRSSRWATKTIDSFYFTSDYKNKKFRDQMPFAGHQAYANSVHRQEKLKLCQKIICHFTRDGMKIFNANVCKQHKMRSSIGRSWLLTFEKI